MVVCVAFGRHPPYEVFFREAADAPASRCPLLNRLGGGRMTALFGVAAQSLCPVNGGLQSPLWGRRSEGGGAAPKAWGNPAGVPRAQARDVKDFKKKVKTRARVKVFKTRMDKGFEGHRCM
jgi:hypothetical protein